MSLLQTSRPGEDSAQTGEVVAENGFWLGRRSAYSILIAVILAVYSYPAVRTAFATKSLRVPAVSAPDLGLYLTLSQLEVNRDGTIVNPYYHIDVPAGSVGLIKFRSGPMLFGLLNHVLKGRIWAALLVWNLAWWLLLCLSTLWLFERFLPHVRVELVLAGLSFLMLFSVESFWRSLTGWSQQMAAGLPYIRPFSPQVGMPLLFCYLGVQILALREQRPMWWGWLAVLQFVAFTAFPYATLMMAGTTAVAAGWYLLARRRGAALLIVLIFMLVCAAADIAFALRGSGGFRSGFPDQTSLINLQPSLIGKSIGKLWILTGILTVAIARSQRLRPEVKWTLVGLGLSNILFVFGDAVISERLLFLSDHIGYFYQSTIVTLLIFLVSSWMSGRSRQLRFARVISLAVVVVCCVYGTSSAEGNYRANRGFNLELADLATWMGRGQVSDHDLVMTRFEGAQYDNCEWVPLLSKAEVLYCRNAQVALTPVQNRDVQRYREVLYLYFDGKDSQWLQNATGFERYGLYGELSSYRTPREQAERVVALRNQMLPFFQRVERADPMTRDFFRRFRRVWIVHGPQTRKFVDTQLDNYLDLGPTETVGGLQITSSNPK